MDIFGAANPDDLQRKIEDKDREDTDYGDAATTEPDSDPSHLFRKYYRGAVLPGDRRIARWQTLCPDADRVPKLAFWWALRRELILPESVVAQLAVALPAHVQRIIFGHGSVGLTWHRFRSVLDYLDRISSIDAISALMVFVEECEYRLVAEDANTARWWIGLTINDVLCRLATFRPFYDVRHFLYDCLEAHVFEENPEQDRVTLTHEQIDRAVDENRRLLTLLGRLGLVGPTFREQTRLLHEYGMNVPGDGSLVEIEEACSALKPIVPSPENPLWETLKWLRHPATRSSRPIELPYKGRSNPNFRIANALGETTVRMSHGPDFVTSRKATPPAKWSRQARR